MFFAPACAPLSGRTHFARRRAPVVRRLAHRLRQPGKWPGRAPRKAHAHGTQAPRRGGQQPAQGKKGRGHAAQRIPAGHPRIKNADGGGPPGHQRAKGKQRVAGDYLHTSAILDENFHVMSAVNEPNDYHGPMTGYQISEERWNEIKNISQAIRPEDI